MQASENQYIGLQYYPAKLTEGKDWYISYYAYCPVKKGLRRKRMKVNRVEGVRVRRELCRKLVNELNQKLAEGWSPFVRQDAGRSMHSMSEILDAYLKYKEKDGEPTSIKACRYFKRDFMLWITDVKRKPEMLAFELGRTEASGFLMYMDENHELMANSYNQILRQCKALCNWMVERRYLSVNPFDGIKPRAAKRKTRQPVSDEVRSLIASHLAKENKAFLVMLLLIYHCLLRPKEICLLKIKDLDTKNGVVFISAEIAKNDKDSQRTMPPSLCRAIESLGLPDSPQMYVFGNNKGFNFSPGAEPVKRSKLNSYWCSLRKELGFGDDCQMYSLKDTGIIDLLSAGVSPEDVRSQADHHSLGMTTIYSNHVRANGIQTVREKSREF